MGDDEFRVPEKTFKRAAKKSIEHISQIPRSILKKRLAEMDLANADLSLQRQIRAIKRSEKSRAIFEGDDCISPPTSPRNEFSSSVFEASDSHYLKRVMQHPERDMEDMVRVIDQEPNLQQAVP